MNLGEEIGIFFKPIDFDIVPKKGELSENLFYNSKDHGFPDIPKKSLVLFSINEPRLNHGILNFINTSNQIRKNLYCLSSFNKYVKLYDLGSLEPGNTIQDTFFAIKQTFKKLILNKCTIILIGNTKELSLPVYYAYKELEEFVNIVEIDSSISHLDFSSEDNPFYLSKIINENPCYLFNFSNIGYQSYYVNPSQTDLMEKLFFESYRLGWVRQNILETEPIIRSGNFLVFNVSSIRFSDLPLENKNNPNGFYGEEACQLSRYAGLSQNLNIFGLFDLFPWNIQPYIGIELSAQIIWYFIEGFVNRTIEIPNDSSQFIKYHITPENYGSEIIFYKNIKNDKWWMEIPFSNNLNQKRFNRFNLIPCSIADYQTACSNDIPERWWKTFQKLNV